MTKLNTKKDKINQLARSWFQATSKEDKCNAADDLYRLIYENEKVYFQGLAIRYNCDVHDIESLHGQAFLKALDYYDGKRDFLHFFKKCEKTERIDFTRSVDYRIHSQKIGQKKDVTEDGNEKNDYLDLLHYYQQYENQPDWSDKPINDDTRREIIEYLVDKSNDNITEKVTQAWLDENIKACNLSSILHYLERDCNFYVDWSTADRRIKKLRKYYDLEAKEKFGEIERYLK